MRRPRTRSKSFRLRVTSWRSCTRAVAAMSESATSRRTSRRIAPARSAIARSTGTSTWRSRRSFTAATSAGCPANSSNREITEYAKPLPVVSRLRARKWSTKTSVSTRCSVSETARTFAPVFSRWHGEVGYRAKSAIERGLVLVRSRLVEVRVDRVAHDCRERLSLPAPARVECLSLSLRQVDLRSRRSHIQHNIQHGEEDDSVLVRLRLA